jgi:hypothetical protein
MGLIIGYWILALVRVGVCVVFWHLAGVFIAYAAIFLIADLVPWHLAPAVWIVAFWPDGVGVERDVVFTQYAAHSSQ